MDRSSEEQLRAEMEDLRRQLESQRSPRQPQDEGSWTRERLAAIVESSDDAIISKNLDGIITTWNAGAQRMFGYSAAEMIGQPIQRIVPPERLAEETGILEKLRRGERVDHLNTVRAAKDGRPIHVSMTLSPIRDQQGRIVGASNIARDIGPQKRIEEELSRAKERAERANSEKDQFLAVLSHELRTPLMPLLAGLALLEGGTGEQGEPLSEPDKAAIIATMRRNIELETQLIDDLLDHTRIMRGKIQLRREISDIHGLIEAVVGMCGLEIRAKQLDIALQLRAQAHFALVDPKRIQQVLWNLLKNAIKFTSKEGRIEIRTRNIEPADKTPGGRSMVIEVADSGIGIAADMIDRIFNPFEQGNRTITRRFGGLGLGLSISKSFVVLHQGTLAVASDGRGRGSTFTVTLPGAMVVGPPSAQLPSAAPVGRSDAAELSGRGLRVLLVEDHADTRRMLSRLLRERGFAIEQAGTVADACALLDRARFDVLVSDIGLPDGTGLEVMNHARAHHAAAPDGRPTRGIAVSGFGTAEDATASRQAGFRMHLTKPLDVEKLEAAIIAVGRGENLQLATGETVQ